MGINNPSNCKADTKSKKKCFLVGKYNFKKVQLTRDLKDDKILYQGIRLPCKNDQGYCDPTTSTQATIVWFPEVTCTIFQLAKIHARMINFHQNYFIESIPFEEVNLDKIRHSYYKIRNIHNIENKLTRFQKYHFTNKPLYKTQGPEILVKSENDFDMNTRK